MENGEWLKLNKWVMADNQLNGVSLSVLGPFHHTFIRTYDFVCVCVSVIVKC